MSGFPLQLRHAEITRVVNRNASRLIMTRMVKPGVYELQDSHVVRRNARYRKDGRWDLELDPGVVTINVVEVVPMRLLDLDLRIVRSAGFKTQREFYDDWLEQRRWIDPATQIRVCRFDLIEAVRMLHRDVSRGYTTNTGLAVRDEPSALSESELKRYADTARWRDLVRKRDEQEDKRLSARVSELERRARDGDAEAQRHLFMIRKHLQSAESRRGREAS